MLRIAGGDKLLCNAVARSGDVFFIAAGNHRSINGDEDLAAVQEWYWK